MALAPEDGTGANGVQLDVNAYGAAVLAMQIETHANITTRDSQAGAWEPFKALIGHYQATHLPIYLNSPRPPVDLAEAGPRHDLDQVVADNVGGVLSIETLRDFGITTSATTSHVTHSQP